MKILFLTDNFPPEVNAPATRTYEHCREWVRAGAEVTVITCNPNFPQGKVYEGYRNKLYQTEMMDGIRVVRVWSYIAANKGFLKRSLDFVSYAVMAFVTSLTHKADIIVATSPQFFTALAGRSASFFKRTPWIIEVRDLWPESIKAVGAMRGDSAAYRLLERVERGLYRSAARVVVVTDTFKEVISGHGITPAKIDVVKNGVLPEQFAPMPKDEELLRQLGLNGKFLVGYIGTHGMAHGLDFILEAARSAPPEVHFVFIGDGARKQALLEAHADLKLKNVTFLPFQPKHEIKRYISILDVALVNLKKSDTFKAVIPSKIFENAAMRKPILLGVEGESQRIIESFGAGRCFEPENETDFLEKLNQLMDPDTYRRCQEGCTRLAEAFDKRRLAARLLDTIRDAATAAA